MIRPELKYGLLAGTGIVLWFYAEFLLGLHATRLALGASTEMNSSPILIVSLWFLLKKQQAALGPAFQVSRGLIAGILTSLVAATVIYIGLSLYCRIINPGWLDAALRLKVEQLRAAGTTEETIRQSITGYREISQPGGLLKYCLYLWTIIGSLMSFFLSLWFKFQGRKAP